MLGTWLVVLFVAGLLFGFVGVLIAANKGVSSAAGFWLGAFLGPIGLVIVALLSPDGDDQASAPAPVSKSFEGERALSNDAYRLWLTSRYAIQRNEVLDRYVVSDRLFPSVDDALHHASELHREEIEAAEAEKQRKAEERERWREQERQRQKEADERFQRWKPYLIGGGVFSVIIIGYLLTLAVQNERRRAKIEGARLAAVKAKQDEARASVNAILAEYGIALADSANDPVVDEKGNCSYSTNSETKSLEGGVAAHFWTESFPPPEALDDVKRLRLSEWDDRSANLYTLMVDAQRLLKNRQSGVEVLATVDDETDYKAPGSLTFKVRVDVCVGTVPEPKPEPAPVEDSTVGDASAEDLISTEDSASTGESDSEAGIGTEYYDE